MQIKIPLLKTKFNQTLTILFLAIFLFPIFKANNSDYTLYGKENEKLISEKFTSIYTKLSNMLKTKPKPQFLHKSRFTIDNPKGYIIYVLEFACSKVTYDIKKIQSLVNSKNVKYIAHIDLNKIVVTNNHNCGNVKTDFGVAGWDNIEGAIKNKDSKPCYKDNQYMDEIRLNFEYNVKNKIWEFKEAIRKNSGREEQIFSAVFGKEVESGLNITEKAGVEFNKVWELLK